MDIRKSRMWILLLIAAILLMLIYGMKSSCGENLKWNLRDGTLTITGSGRMRVLTYRSRSRVESFSTLFFPVERNTGNGRFAGNRDSVACVETQSVAVPSRIIAAGTFGESNRNTTFRNLSGTGQREIYCHHAACEQDSSD